MKLTLIGYGFVGKAVYEVLKDHHEVRIVDPEYNDNVIDNDSDGYVDSVDGTITSTVTTKRANNGVVITAPTYTAVSNL